MRARLAAALVALAGCGADNGPAPLTAGAPAAPDRAVVETLAAVHLAQARAELAGDDIDSARGAALSDHGATRAEYDRWLDNAARDPAAGAALWEAVAATLDSARTAGGR